MGQELYKILIAPVEETLAENNVETLVFVLDGALRNTPMAALYDGASQQYLIEKYNLAVTPGLQLVNPESIQDKALSGLLFGLTDCESETCQTVNLDNGDSYRFNELPAVDEELDAVDSFLANTKIVKDAEFTTTEFGQSLKDSTASIIHLATHGKFSSDPNGTFLLTSNGPIDVNEFSEFIKENETRNTPIELLVLSACETASGDPRAALGMAGIAIRAGARSTLASLWSVDDVGTSALMQVFYDALATQEVTKAEALRKAQLAILKNPRFRGHPYFWSPFVMIGNWL